MAGGLALTWHQDIRSHDHMYEARVSGFPQLFQAYRFSLNNTGEMVAVHFLMSSIGL